MVTGTVAVRKASAGALRVLDDGSELIHSSAPESELAVWMIYGEFCMVRFDSLASCASAGIT